MTLIERLFSLNGRVAIVTGASRGIGAAIAGGYAAAGATVIGVGRSPSPDVATPGVDYARCDITDRESFARLVDEITARHGRIDVLANAAGMTAPGADAFETTLAINLNATYRCIETVATVMKLGGSGSIVNVTSIGSVLGFPGNPGYVAAKGGLRMLTRALALDLGASNIRVNNLAPGYIRTAMTEASYQDPARNEARRARTMLDRWGMPDDLVGAAIFLAAPASAYVTGADLFVDGGWTAKGL